jgi:hypothetical protein
MNTRVMVETKDEITRIKALQKEMPFISIITVINKGIYLKIKLLK